MVLKGALTQLGAGDDDVAAGGCCLGWILESGSAARCGSRNAQCFACVCVCDDQRERDAESKD